jgi:DNA repair exonuclease SbcCD ATPase subunit
MVSSVQSELESLTEHSNILEENHKLFLVEIDEIGSKEAELNSFNFVELDKININLNTLVENLTNTENEYENLQKQLRESNLVYKNQAEFLENQIFDLNQIILQKDTILTEINRQQIENEIKLQDLSTQKSSLSVELEKCDSELHEISKKKALLDFWKNAFGYANNKGEFRKFILQQYIDIINPKFQNTLDELCDGHQHNLRCKLGNNLLITHDGNSIPFSQRSQGEQKKTILALLLTIMDLMREKSSFVPYFLFIDEMYDSLDESSRKQIDNVISQYTNEHPELLIFVITHTEHENDGVGVIEVNRTHNDFITYNAKSYSTGNINI